MRKQLRDPCVVTGKKSHLGQKRQGLFGSQAHLLRAVNKCLGLDKAALFKRNSSGQQG